MSEYLSKSLRDRLDLLKATGHLADFPFVVHGTTAMENYLGKPISNIELLIEREDLSRLLAKHSPDFYNLKDLNGAYRIHGIVDGQFAEVYSVTPIDNFNGLNVSGKMDGFENIRILSKFSTVIDFVTGRNDYSSTDIENLSEMDEKFLVIKNYSLHPEFSNFRYYLSKAKKFDTKDILPVIKMGKVDEAVLFSLPSNVYDCTIFPSSVVGITNNRIYDRENKEVLLIAGDKIVIDEYIKPSFINAKKAIIHHHIFVKELNGEIVFDVVDVDTFNEKPCTFDIQSLSSHKLDLAKSLSDSICTLFGIPKQDRNIDSICFYTYLDNGTTNQKLSSNNPLCNELTNDPDRVKSKYFDYVIDHGCLNLDMTEWTTNIDPHLTSAMVNLVQAIGGHVSAKIWVNGKYPKYVIKPLY